MQKFWLQWGSSLACSLLSFTSLLFPSSQRDVFDSPITNGVIEDQINFLFSFPPFSY